MRCVENNSVFSSSVELLPPVVACFAVEFNESEGQRGSEVNSSASFYRHPKQTVGGLLAVDALIAPRHVECLGQSSVLFCYVGIGLQQMADLRATTHVNNNRTRVHKFPKV